jgi:hypothetical protein
MRTKTFKEFESNSLQPCNRLWDGILVGAVECPSHSIGHVPLSHQTTKEVNGKASVLRRLYQGEQPNMQSSIKHYQTLHNPAATLTCCLSLVK